MNFSLSLLFVFVSMGGLIFGFFSFVFHLIFWFSLWETDLFFPFWGVVVSLLIRTGTSDSDDFYWRHSFFPTPPHPILPPLSLSLSLFLSVYNQKWMTHWWMQLLLIKTGAGSIHVLDRMNCSGNGQSNRIEDRSQHKRHDRALRMHGVCVRVRVCLLWCGRWWKQVNRLWVSATFEIVLTINNKYYIYSQRPRRAKWPRWLNDKRGVIAWQWINISIRDALVKDYLLSP